MTSTERQLIVQLAQGNPGAAVALGEVCRVHDAVDPDADGGGLILLFQLIDFKLSGPSIHILFKYVCKCDPARFIMLVRAWQLGFLLEKDLQAASISGRGPVLDTDSLWDRVSETLPRFQKRGAIGDKKSTLGLALEIASGLNNQTHGE